MVASKKPILGLEVDGQRLSEWSNGGGSPDGHNATHTLPESVAKAGVVQIVSSTPHADHG